MTPRRERLSATGPGSPALWQSIAARARPVEFLSRAQRRYGPTFTFSLAPAGRMITVGEPSAALRLLEECPHAGRVNAATLPAVLAARSAFFAEGEESRRRRALHRGWLDAALSAGTEQRLVAAADRSVCGWPAGRPFPLLPRMRLLLAQALVPLLADVPGPGAQRDLAAAARALINPLAATAATALGAHPATRPLATALLNRHRYAFGQLVAAEISRRQARPGQRASADALAVRSEFIRPNEWWVPCSRDRVPSRVAGVFRR